MENTLTREALLDERKNDLLSFWKQRKLIFLFGFLALLAVCAFGYTAVGYFNRNKLHMFYPSMFSVGAFLIMAVFCFYHGFKAMWNTRRLEKKGLSEKELKEWRKELEESQEERDRKSAMLRVLKES